MVLCKRGRDGEFVRWVSASATGSSSKSVISRFEVDEPREINIPPTSEDTFSLDQPITPKGHHGQPAAVRQATTQSSSLHPRPAKRPRTSKSEAAPKPEKRGATFKKSCPKNILDRVDRVMLQRFFMVDRQRVPGALSERFSVLGSTGNVYTVIIGQKPSCDCPDACKGNHCKHILFIYLKVLQVSQQSGVWYQKALLTNELESIFAQAPVAPNAVSHPRAREAFERAIGRSTSTAINYKSKSKSTDSGSAQRLPGPVDDCPICYETMYGTAVATLVFCEQCGNALHSECFGQWRATASSKRADLTCVWCRAPWGAVAGASGSASATSGRARGGARMTRDGYINLGSAIGLSGMRDTSSYYHGPTRGRRHLGYREYGGISEDEDGGFDDGDGEGDW